MRFTILQILEMLTMLLHHSCRSMAWFLLIFRATAMLENISKNQTIAWHETCLAWLGMEIASDSYKICIDANFDADISKIRTALWHGSCLHNISANEQLFAGNFLRMKNHANKRLFARFSMHA